MAGSEMQALVDLNQKISEADDVSSEGRPGDGVDAEDSEGETAMERVLRYQAVYQPAGIDSSAAAAVDDPYWLQSFLCIATKDLGFDLNGGCLSSFEPIKVLSGCTGMLAEGWVCKLLGIPVESFSCSDPKSDSFQICDANFGQKIHQWHPDLREQMSHQERPCNSDSQQACEAGMFEDVPLACIGTPCQPFSRQRTKRSAENSVRSHSKFETTMTELSDWLQTFEPRCAICEQVEGIAMPESKSCRTTPLERLIEMLNVKKWSRGGYHIGTVHLDTCIWINMSRPRIYLVLLRKDIATADTLARVIKTIQDICTHRAKMEPAKWMDLLLKGKDLDDAFSRYGHSRSMDGSGKQVQPGDAWALQEENAYPKWKQESLNYRNRAQVSPSYSPWTGQPQFQARGMRVTARVKDLLDCITIAVLRATDSPAAMMKQQLEHVFADVSQGLCRAAYTQNGLNKCLTTSSSLYSFGADRMVTALECLKFQGYPVSSSGRFSLHVPSSLGHTSLKEFSGEGMALPCLACVIFSLYVHVIRPMSAHESAQA